MAVSQHAYRAPVRLRPPLLSLDEAARLDCDTVARLSNAHLTCDGGPAARLALHGLTAAGAEGAFYLTRDGRRVLDFSSGFGAHPFGNGHPRILEARRRAHGGSAAEDAAAVSRYGAALAHNLAAIAPADLDIVGLAFTRGEVLQAAIAQARQAQKPGRSRVLQAGSAEARPATSAPGEAGPRAPFGDIACIEAALAADPGIGVIVMQTIQRGGIEAPDGFWQELRRLCDRNGVLWVADETDCGLGRSGRFFAFEFDGVAPDVAVLGTGLGGGAAPLAATIARRQLAQKRRRHNCLPGVIGPSGLDGMGEVCCAALTALDLLYDERLMENAAVQGDRLLGRLEEIAASHPGLVKAVHGRGLMAGLEFHGLERMLPFGLRHAASALDGFGINIAALVAAVLLHDHDILVLPPESGCSLLRLEPPLVAAGEDIDRFATALDEALSRGLARLLTDFLRRQAAGQVRT